MTGTGRLRRSAATTRSARSSCRSRRSFRLAAGPCASPTRWRCRRATKRRRRRRRARSAWWRSACGCARRRTRSASTSSSAGRGPSGPSRRSTWKSAAPSARRRRRRGGGGGPARRRPVGGHVGGGQSARGGFGGAPPRRRGRGRDRLPVAQTRRDRPARAGVRRQALPRRPRASPPAVGGGVRVALGVEHHVPPRVGAARRGAAARAARPRARACARDAAATRACGHECAGAAGQSSGALGAAGRRGGGRGVWLRRARRGRQGRGRGCGRGGPAGSRGRLPCVELGQVMGGRAGVGSVKQHGRCLRCTAVLWGLRLIERRGLVPHDTVGW
ncbi:hypothetical protein BU14_0711s0011 [Porphyra umbilicalis]|uniref:Uncharacterized protein n=1 Tax=Porphyra umbilicalis TaxID=2786 RepID=A0A1X6NPT1_PORUM|nr:hypothetical protein BU14_0711s0011 [Porphyra umbilicalis]|eukprot:OSX70614.1 hypothetical protein BU14_0711s0011 [Porphyra umbilicalis]